MNSPPPLLDAAALAAAGRTPPAPFRIASLDEAGNARELTLLRLLRVLPGKRIVGEGHETGAENTRRLVKLFIDPHSGRRWRQEHQGILALTAAGVPTPPVIAAHALRGGGHALLTAFLDGATTLLDAWRPLAARPPGDPAAIALLAPAFALLGRAHSAGLSHNDLHFGNFLLHEGVLHLIDGDAVHNHGSGPLEEKHAARDLAMLLAQLPRAWGGNLNWDGPFAPLLDAYCAASPRPLSAAATGRALTAERAWRLTDYLSKTGRDCSLFKVTQSPGRFTALVRAEADTLEPLLTDPDRWMDAGEPLKRGNTCTVTRVENGGRALVVKRYNLKNLRHALSRFWRPSRAWHSWREGHRLRLFGIPTPAPLALIEERRGPLRGRAWLVTEHCPGPSLLAHLPPDAPPPQAEATALRELFTALHRERISHGDLKATNLLWNGSAIELIDLDAMRQHRSAAAHARAWQRDRRRLLRNWPEESPLHRWLDENLPR